MIEAEYYTPFIDWLNEPQDDDDERGWDELGLQSNAPKSAVEAFSEFLEIVKERKKLGVK